MNTQSEPASAAAPAVSRWLLLVQFSFLLISLAAAAYGLVRHNSLWWGLGATWSGCSFGSWLSQRWLRNDGPDLTTFERSIIMVKAYGFAMPLASAVSIGFMILFPNWFPPR